MNTQVIQLSNPLWLETLQKIPHDIYQLPEYFALEAIRTKTLPEAILIHDDDRILFAPYLLRTCNDIETSAEYIQTEIFDVVSPYGYPGILLSQTAVNTSDFLDIAINELKQVLRQKGVCSAFFRLHPIINQNLSANSHLGVFIDNGKTVSRNLELSEQTIWYQTQPGRRKKINQCKQSGLKARMVVFEEYIDEFAEIYAETMTRVSSAAMYYTFNNEYFSHMKDLLGKKLHLCIVELDNQVASAALYTEYCGIVQNLFRGTRTKFCDLSPSSLEIDYVRFWAKERGNKILHLGGGLGGSQNNLYNFKASFSKLRHIFLTMRLIIDEEKYHFLVGQRAKYLNIGSEQLLNSHFFPAYRYQEQN
ncbi:peptidoglycan bridge formation glycyltransferase FemA/FemB family protein [Scytonema sp. PCC 10023]|uniref:peptidoglycan bridge formation glycyltransferase FemA/FemB family protein n=1 Tax=Scytonema sp. PCC 10023 TaxID=1680591 RepID=UPI0039C602F1